jgi:hypothetical protein
MMLPFGSYWTSAKRIADLTIPGWAGAGRSGDLEIASTSGGGPVIVWLVKVRDGIVRKVLDHIGPLSTTDAALSEISQAVKITDSLESPVLSFMIRSKGMGTPSAFSVRVDDGESVTTVVSRTAEMGRWTHQWVDIDQWIGQPITLTLGLQQEAGGLPAVVYIDDVTIGSSNSDIWVGIQAPTTALPGEAVTLTLRYGNRGLRPASNAQLFLNLPSSIQFAGADPAPDATGTSLAWNLADMDGKTGTQTVVVTGTVAAETPMVSMLMVTASIETVNGELETANNDAGATIVVGYRLYLASIYR